MFLLGDAIGRRFFTFVSVQHRLAGAFLFGLLFSTWFSYLAALIFSGTSSSLFWSNLLFFIVASGLCFLFRGNGINEQPGNGAFGRIYSLISGKDSTGNDEIVLDSPRRPIGKGKWDWIFLGGCLVFGCWLMFATLDFSEGSFKFVIKAWNDFGANISLSQSMALGNNFPVEHPFFPAETARYHFLFWFQAANLSFLGLNLVWSVNLLSLLSLAALLVLITTLAELLFNSRVVGMIAAILFFFGSTSLSYIPFFQAQAGIADSVQAVLRSTTFLNSGYPFRGETWGGLTINIYAYQRHLIAGAGMFLFVVVFLVDLYRRKKIILPPEFDPETISGNEPGHEQNNSAEVGNEVVIASEDDSEDKLVEIPDTKLTPLTPRDFRGEIYALILAGVMIGALPYWNSGVFAAAAVVLASLLVVFPYRRYLALLIATSVVIGLPQLLILRSGNIASTGDALFNWGYTVANPTIPLVLEYIGWTFGLKLILIVIAIWFAPRTHRLLLVAFSSLVPVVFLLQLSMDAFNNHKLLNVWNILMTVYVAYALWLIGKRSIFHGILATILALAMVFSSIIDLFPLHNDAFVSVPFHDDRLTTWLLHNTGPRDIFLSDTLLSHPIVFSGRKVFLGNTLFAWTAGYDMVERDKNYRAMWRERDLTQLMKLLSDNKIAYVAIDDNLRRNPALPDLNEPVYQQNFEKVFEDTEHRYANLTIYRVAQPSADAPISESNSSAAANVDMGAPAVTAFVGGPGKGRGQFAGPRGIATDADGNFYVADTGNARIQKFASDGNLLVIFGISGSGVGQLFEPNGVAVAPGGDLYIVDAGNHRLLRFKADGTFVKQWEGPESKFFGPRDVALGPNKLVYILDQGRSRVVRLDPETDRMTEWGMHGSGESEFVEPTGIEVGDDRVYVADALNNRIQVFSLDGLFIAAWPVPEWNSYPWQYPDVTFEPKEKLLYVTSPLSKEILTFDLNGNRLNSLKPETPVDMENASSLAISNTKKEKRLYGVSTGGSKVFLFELVPDTTPNKK